MISYVDYVEEQLNKWEKYHNMVTGDYVTPEMINTALAEYSKILISLIAELGRIKQKYVDEEMEFNIWFSKKYKETREKLCPFNSSANKWPSKTEIESYVRVEYENEYREKHKALKEIEGKMNFIDGLLSGWKKRDQVIISLANNMRSEMRELSIERRINKDL